MLKTGQVPVDINAMPGLMLDESEDKDREMGSRINAMHSGNTCFFCKKSGHLKKDFRKYEDWKKKNSNRHTGNGSGNSYRKQISCYNCGKEGHISRECKSVRKNAGRRDNGNSGNGQMAYIAKSWAIMQEVLMKRFFR